MLLSHMQDCRARIHEYAGRERARFDASRLVQDAVIRNLQTLAGDLQLTAALTETPVGLRQDVDPAAVTELLQAVVPAATVSCSTGSPKPSQPPARRLNRAAVATPQG